MKILAISGSTRAGSFNTLLARMVAQSLPGHVVNVEAGLGALPFYNADVEAAGVPAPVRHLRDAVDSSDLVVIATPEYNSTTPGVLMNAIEWLSRPHRECVLDGKRILVISASPSPGGGRSSAAHLRSVLEHIGADLVHAEFSVAKAHRALEPGSAGLMAAQQELRATLTGIVDGLYATVSP